MNVRNSEAASSPPVNGGGGGIVRRFDDLDRLVFGRRSGERLRCDGRQSEAELAACTGDSGAPGGSTARSDAGAGSRCCTSRSAGRKLRYGNGELHGVDLELKLRSPSASARSSCAHPAMACDARCASNRASASSSSGRVGLPLRGAHIRREMRARARLPTAPRERLVIALSLAASDAESAGHCIDMDASPRAVYQSAPPIRPDARIRT